MDSTIIIDKILVHMLDQEHGQVIYSDEFIDLETLLEYYDKKLEKTFSSTSLKELVVGEHHHLLNAAKLMCESDEEFIQESRKIAYDIFDVSKLIEQMPPSDLLFVECKKDGVKFILVIKLNYKKVPVSVIDEDDGKRKIKVMNVFQLPAKNANVEEAIVVNVDENKLYVIEKRFTIDGKPGYYLNEQYIKGELKLSDREKMNIVNKTIKKVDSEFDVFTTDPTAKVKEEVFNLMDTYQKIRPVELAKKLLEDNYEAQEEALNILEECGIQEEDEIVNVPMSTNRLTKCKLVLDDDKVLELPIDDYLHSEFIEDQIDEQGLHKIIIHNVKEVVVK